ILFFSIILIYTSFTYKNWSLSMLWNFHISGDIYNGTDYFMTARSMSVRNANRENPTIKRVIVNGKDTEGKETYTPATYTFSADKFYNRNH
ncbi:hypothetical protein, partial [Bacteroides sp.]